MIHYWDGWEQHHAGGGPTAEQLQAREQFESSPASVVTGELTYTLPSGYQLAGEGWEHQIGGSTFYVQPCVKSVIRSFHRTDGTDPVETEDWSLVPTLLSLSMDALELVSEAPVLPAEPTISYYRDGLRALGEGPIFRGLGDSVGLPRMARIGDVGADLSGWLRVGQWFIPQFAQGNQLIALNLETETTFRAAGWDSVPLVLRRADPYTDLTWEAEEREEELLEFQPYLHSRNYYTVLGRINNDRVLILRETQSVGAEVISDFAGTGLGPIGDDFKRKWINRSGTAPSGVAGHVPYNWDEGSLLCGGLRGEPWTLDPLDPVRGEGAAVSEMTAAITADLGEISVRPRYARSRVAASHIYLDVWEFPAEGSPAWIETLQEWGPDRDVGGLQCGQSSYSITSTTLGSIPKRIDPAYPDNYVVDTAGLDPEGGEGYLYNSDSGFEAGAGVAVYSPQPYPSPAPGEYRWWIDSEDRNNCPGPGGPWFDRDYVDNNPGLARLFLWVRSPLVQRCRWPNAPAWDPCNFVSDGGVAIFLPGGGSGGLALGASKESWRIRCLPIEEGESGWSLDIREALPGPDGFKYLFSNGVLSQQYLYLVCTHSSPSQWRLLKVAVRGEQAGEVVAARDYDQPIGEIMIVNRRVIGLVGDTWTALS